MSTVSTRAAAVLPISLLGRLTAVGTALHGADWQRAVARDLGPLHPVGARDQVDDRLVRRWVSGERPVPRWVAAALPGMLAAGVSHRRTEVAALLDLYDRLVADMDRDIEAARAGNAGVR